MNRWLLAFLLFSPCAVLAAGDDAPPPRKAPRTPVSSVPLPDAPKPTLMRQYEGAAEVLDAERLRVADTELRLFGIVPPQLQAAHGPQARALLDSLLRGHTAQCLVRDKDRAGRSLVTCRTPQTPDVGLALLRAGLAVVARGSTRGTDLEAPYDLAETQAAQAGLGLWMQVPGSFGSKETAQKTAAPAGESSVPPTGASAAAAAASAAPPAPRQNSGTLTVNLSGAPFAPAGGALTPPAAGAPPLMLGDESSSGAAGGFFARYQILLAALIFLLAGLAALGAAWLYPLRRAMLARQALGAALQGELMAMRRVCCGKMLQLDAQPDPAPATWPRLRSFVYRAYVGQIGLLGPHLARQVSALYGQLADHAAFQEQAGTLTVADLRRILPRLMEHMEETLMGLAAVSATGRAYVPARAAPAEHQAEAADPVSDDMPPAMESEASPDALSVALPSGETVAADAAFAADAMDDTPDAQQEDDSEKTPRRKGRRRNAA